MFGFSNTKNMHSMYVEKKTKLDWGFSSGFDTYIGGLMMLNSSAGDWGTRRTIILRPSVEPIPIDANDRIDVAFENIFPDPLQSPNTDESVRGNDNNVCNGCGEVCDVVNVFSFTSKWLPVCWIK